MKKVLALSFVLGLAACGGGAKESAGGTTTAGSTTYGNGAQPSPQGGPQGTPQGSPMMDNTMNPPAQGGPMNETPPPPPSSTQPGPGMGPSGGMPPQQ